MLFGQRGTPLGQQQFSAAALSTVQTVTAIAGAQTALIEVDGAGLRFRDDGIAPTASTGILIPVGKIFEYTGNIGALQIISTAGGGAICNISQYGCPPFVPVLGVLFRFNISLLGSHDVLR